MHIPWGEQIGAADFGAEALLDTEQMLLRWFNHWLKDRESSPAEPKIRHFAHGRKPLAARGRLPRPDEIRICICTARGAQIRAKGMERSRADRTEADEP